MLHHHKFPAWNLFLTELNNRVFSSRPRKPHIFQIKVKWRKVQILGGGQATPASSHHSLPSRAAQRDDPSSSLPRAFRPVTGSLQLRAAASLQGLAPSRRTHSPADVVLVRSLPAAVRRDRGESRWWRWWLGVRDSGVGGQCIDYFRCKLRPSLKRSGSKKDKEEKKKKCWRGDFFPSVPWRTHTKHREC